MSEDEYALEKQRLEREIKNKEFDMFALQDEIKYKDEELRKTSKHLPTTTTKSNKNPN